MPPTHPRENFGFRISDFPPTHPREFSVLSFEFWVLSYCPPSRFHYPKAVISSEAVGRAEKSAGRMGRGSLFVSQACPERGRRPSRMIGIGGRLATPLLPHHRAYGSRTRRFGQSSVSLRLQTWKSERVEVGDTQCDVHAFVPTHRPGTTVTARRHPGELVAQAQSS